MLFVMLESLFALGKAYRLRHTVLLESLLLESLLTMLYYAVRKAQTMRYCAVGKSTDCVILCCWGKSAY
jgi:hypothetical protein